MVATTLDGHVQRALAGMRWLGFRDAREDAVGPGTEGRLVASGARAGVQIANSTELADLVRFRQESPVEDVLLFFSTGTCSALSTQYAADEGIALFQLPEGHSSVIPTNRVARSLVGQAAASYNTTQSPPVTHTEPDASPTHDCDEAPTISRRGGRLIEDWFWTGVILILGLAVLAMAAAARWPLSEDSGSGPESVTGKITSCSSRPNTSVVEMRGTVSNGSSKPMQIELTAVVTVRRQHASASTHTTTTLRLPGHRTRALNAQIHEPRGWVQADGQRSCVARISRVT